MFGYASDETPDLLPATLYYSHRILERMAEARHSGKAPFLEPDAKSQVTLEYANEKPVRATPLVVSTQHSPSLSNPEGQKTLTGSGQCRFGDWLPGGGLP